MSIKLGETWYDFTQGSLESLGGRNGLNIYVTNNGCTGQLLAELKRSPARSDDAEALIRTPNFYLTEIIEKSIEKNELFTALEAVRLLTSLSPEQFYESPER